MRHLIKATLILLTFWSSSALYGQTLICHEESNINMSVWDPFAKVDPGFFIKQSDMDSVLLSLDSLTGYMDTVLVDCDNVTNLTGANPVFIRGYKDGNQYNCRSTYQYLDKNPPVVIVKNDIEIYIKYPACSVKLFTQHLDDGTFDHCGLDTITMSRYNFDSDDQPVVPVEFRATDIYQNSNSAIVNIKINIDSECNEGSLDCKEYESIGHFNGEVKLYPWTFINNIIVDSTDYTLILTLTNGGVDIGNTIIEQQHGEEVQFLVKQVSTGYTCYGTFYVNEKGFPCDLNEAITLTQDTLFIYDDRLDPKDLSLSFLIDSLGFDPQIVEPRLDTTICVSIIGASIHNIYSYLQDGYLWKIERAFSYYNWDTQQESKVFKQVIIHPRTSSTGDIVLEDVLVFPNPVTSEILNLSTNDSQYQIKLFDLSGKELAFYSDTKTINLTNLTNGIYVYKYRSVRGIKTGKIVLAR